MYISIKLPAAFGSFNQLRKENYPFNNLFTSYLAAVARLGLGMKMDVEELVGYIEDRIFDGQRVPDVPEGTEPVNIRYKVNIPEDADETHPGNVVKQYIEGSILTNRMAVMYIARMTLRLSAAYGTSLMRLTRLITDLGMEKPAKKRGPKPKPEARKPEPVMEEPVIAEPAMEEPAEDPEPPMPKISRKAPEPKPEPMPVPEEPIKLSTTAEEARAAVNALAGLVGDIEPEEDTPIVETNPALRDFL